MPPFSRAGVSQGKIMNTLEEKVEKLKQTIDAPLVDWLDDNFAIKPIEATKEDIIESNRLVWNDRASK